jgi:hypothetical protein
MTTSITTINIIITGQIAHTAAKINTAEYREAALKIVHADSNENMQANTKINHGKKSTTCVRNLDASQLNIPAINDNKHLASSAEPLEKYLIESQQWHISKVSSHNSKASKDYPKSITKPSNY